MTTVAAAAAAAAVVVVVVVVVVAAATATTTATAIASSIRDSEWERTQKAFPVSKYEINDADTPRVSDHSKAVVHTTLRPMTCHNCQVRCCPAQRLTTLTIASRLEKSRPKMLCRLPELAV